MKEVEYNHKDPKNVQQSNRCSRQQNATIARSVRRVEGWIRKAYAEWDTPKSKRL
jgi:hypothetical protein